MLVGLALVNGVALLGVSGSLLDAQGALATAATSEGDALRQVPLASAFGYSVGDTLLISSEAFDSRVRATAPRRVLIEWPWREVDAGSRNSWDGTFGFSRVPEAPDWANTPWRVDPEPADLATGDPCLVGIPPTLVRVQAVGRYGPPADFGFLPRPEYYLALAPVDAVDTDAGYLIYLDDAEPIAIEHR